MQHAFTIPPSLSPARMISLSSVTLLMLFALACEASATSEQSRFEILRGNKVLGMVIAMKSSSGTRTNYVMTSYAEYSLAWKQVVRTRMTAEYLGDVLNACTSSFKVNDGLRDSSHMARGAEHCFIHPEIPFACERTTQWTTARMYFEEPVEQQLIFVESALKDLPLHRTGEGTYTLTLSNNTRNHYVYRGGVLHEIHIERPLVGLVFRRV